MTDLLFADSTSLRGTHMLFAARLPAAMPSTGRGELTAIVVKLLSDAEAALGTDRQAARACIERASALLQAADKRCVGTSARERADVAGGGLAPRMLRRVRVYIDANLAAPIRLPEVAGIARLSAGRFGWVFKFSTGESVRVYIVRRRIERAQEMMLTTNEILCQIALACGFSDQSHFSSLFRRVTGISPSVWRRQ